jgi:hypothetical protein
MADRNTMKLRILEPVMLGGGLSAKAGDVVEVSEMAAHNIITVGRGEALKAPAEPAPAPTTSTVEVREPVAETRDPAPPKARGNRRE